jgi:predicted nucleic acid-binding protein
MRLVIDASAAVYLASSRDGFSGVAHHELVGPPLLLSESVSALHQAVWRGQASRELAQGSLTVLLRAPIALVPLPGIFERAWAVADELGWAKTYDAEYVALADLLGCGLLTTDARLLRGASRLIPILQPRDL